jgi:hypothetical protein
MAGNGSSGERAGWFVAWLLVGAAYGVGVIGILSIGIFVLPLALIATLLLVLRPAARAGAAGAVVGVGLPLLYVAYLNRSGPGTVCTATRSGGQACVDESNPWLWLAAALVIIAVGVAVTVARRGRNGGAG